MESDFGFNLIGVDVTKDFEFGNDYKREEHEQQAHRKTTQMTRYYIPSQAIMSVEELKKEIKSGIAMGQKIYVSHVLEVLRGRDLPFLEKVEYSIARIYLLCQEKMIDVAQKEANLLFYTPDFFSYELHVLKLLLMLARARHAFGAYWLAYADHQRAMSIINDMKLRGRSRDEEIDDVISTFEVFGERLVSILIKQSFTQTLCVYGENVKNTMSCDSAENLDKDGFKTYLELKNRRVIQIVSSEFHTLALVDHDVINVKIANPLHFSAFKTPDVFGWGSNQHGQILGISTSSPIESPTIIRQFLGKDIKGISANNLISLCWDAKGEVFIWGKKKSQRKEFERVYSAKNGIVTCKVGANFILIWTQDNKLFYQGTIPDRHFEDMFIELKKDFILEDLQVGNDHIIAMSKEKKFYGIGSNLKGQLGVGEATLYENEFKELHFQEFVPQKSIAFLDRTIFISTKGEIFLLGAFYDNKRRGERNAWFPMKLMVEGENKVEIMQIESSETKVMFLDKGNDAYMWDLCKGRNFKKLEFENEALFSSVSITKDYTIFQKEIFDPKTTHVVHIDKSQLSYEPINIKIQANNAAGFPIKRSNKNNRYHVLFYNNPVQRIRDIQKMVYETACLESVPIEKRTGLHIRYNENTSVPVMKLSVSQDEKEPSIQHVNFTFTSNGEYYIYIFLNETLLDGMPLILKVAKGKTQLKEEEAVIQQKIAAKRIEYENNRKQEVAHHQKLKNEIDGWEGKQTTHITTTKRADDFFRFYMEMGKELTSRTNTDVDLLRQIKAGGGYNEQIINDLEVIRSDHPRLIHEDLRKPISTYSKQTFSSMSQDNKKNEVVRKRLIHSTVNHQKDGIEVPRRDINARLKFFLNQDDMKRDNYGCRVVEKYDRSYFETRSNVAMAALRQCVNYNNEGSEQSKQSESSPSTRRSKGFFAIPSPQSSSRFLTRSVSQPIIIEKPPTKPNDRDKSAGKSLTPTHPVVHTFPIIEDETINETPRKEKEASTSIQKSKTEKTLSTNTKTIVSARQYTRPPVPKRSPATPLRLDNILNTSEDVSSKKNKSFSTRDLSAIREKNNKSSVQLSEVKPEQTKKKTQTFRKRLFANKNNKIKNVATKGKQNETATEADIDAEAENEFDTEVLLRSITPPRVENEVSGTKTPRVQKNNNSSRPTTATDNDELESLVTRKNSVFGKKSRPSTAQMMAFRTEQSESDRPITPTPPMVTNSTFTVRSPQHSESVDHERPTFKNMSKAREHLEITKLSTIRSSPIEEYYSPADRGTYKRHNRNNFDRMKKPVPKKELFKEIGKINLELPEKRIARVRSQKDFTVKNAYNLSAPKAQ